MEIIEAEACAGYIHILVNISPNISVTYLICQEKDHVYDTQT